jgi:endoglycosylceramidase
LGSRRASSAAGGWANAGIVQARGGPYLTDAFGRRLELHGVNLVAKCGGGARATTAAGTPCVGPAQGPRLAYVLSPAARDPGRRFTAADARTLARLGFNTVRLGIIWEGLEPGPASVGPNDPRYCTPHRRGSPFPSLGRADPYDPATVRAYLARTDRIVALLARAGLRVVIDMHSDAWGSAFYYATGPTPWNGEGAPPWATCTGRAPLSLPSTWGAAYGAPAVQMALHHFWANDVRANLQGQLARVWQAVARHYRDDPDVIGYEVSNEPNDFLSRNFNSELQCDYGGPVHEPRSCAASHPAALRDGLIGAIQVADPNHVVLFEPSGSTDYGAPETIGIAEPLRFPRLALAFHVYGSAPAQLAQAIKERDRTRTDQPGGPAWIMDEFGASNEAAPSIAETVSRAGAANLSWTYWSAMQLHDPTAADPFEGLLNQQTRRPYPALAHALAVPYPWATAGQPGPQSFNRRTLAFSYSYAVARAVHAPTEIAVPPYTYPHGYTVRVTGARIVSARDAPVLRLAADRRAARVTLTVRVRKSAEVRGQQREVGGAEPVGGGLSLMPERVQQPRAADLLEPRALLR